MTQPYASVNSKVVRVIPNTLEHTRAGVEALFFEASAEVPPGSAVDWNEADNGFHAEIADPDEGSGTIDVTFGATASGRTQVTIEFTVNLTRAQLRDEYNGSKKEFTREINEGVQEMMGELVGKIRAVAEATKEGPSTGMPRPNWPGMDRGL